MPGNPDNQYTTLLEALHAASARGFGLRFSFREGQLFCEETQTSFSENEVIVEEFHRFEGASDPDESAIVYFLKTYSGLKGTLVDGYGMASDAALSGFLQQVKIDRSETTHPGAFKKCLNCGTPLKGKFCYQCGQKDEHLHEPFWKLAAHFAGDFFHFESRFFKTTVPLLFKPGFLTREYMEGKRARYMKPVQMYIFISLLFFLCYFTFQGSHDGMEVMTVDDNLDAGSLVDSLLAEGVVVNPGSLVKDSSGNSRSPVTGRPSLRMLDSLTGNRDTISTYTQDGINFGITGARRLPETVEAYEDSISKLPADQRPSRMARAFSKRQIIMNRTIREKGEKQFWRDVLENFTHGIPKALFFLLPLFAVILKVFYLRKKVYLVDHAIFTLHYHSFLFLLLLLLLLIKLATGLYPDGGWMLLMIWVYLILALRKTYGQRWMGAVLKSIGILVLYSLIAVVVAVLSLGITVFTA